MIIQVQAGRFKGEISDFVTKRRSGFGQQTGGGQKRMLQTRGRMLAPNLMSVSQLRLSLSGFPEGAAEAFRSFAALLEEGPGRGDPEAFAAVGLHKRLLGRAVLGKCAEGRERRSGPPGRSGFLPVHQSDAENPHCRSHSPVRRTARREARRSRRSTKAWACSTPAARSALTLLCHCTRQGPKSSKDWGA